MDDAWIVGGGPAAWELERLGARDAQYKWTADATFGGVTAKFVGGSDPRAKFAASISLKYPPQIQDLMRAAGGLFGNHPFISQFAEAMEVWKRYLKPLGYDEVLWNAADAEVRTWAPASSLLATLKLVSSTAVTVNKSFLKMCKQVAGSETALALRKNIESRKARKKLTR
jgi:hypothetical protein